MPQRSISSRSQKQGLPRTAECELSQAGGILDLPAGAEMR
jgi:hypothetical protein